MARAGRRSAVGTGCLVLVLLVAVLLVAGAVADRLVEDRVEDRIAARLQTELGTPQPPDVDVEGFPFLTQAVDRELRSVHVVAQDTSAAAPAGLAARRLDVRLEDVTSSSDYATVVAGRLAGTATLDLAALSGGQGQELRYAGEGRVTTTAQRMLFGRSVAVRVTGRPELDVATQSVTLADVDLVIGGVPVPGPTAQALLRTVVRPIPIRGVPPRVRVTSLVVDDEGARAGLAGDDVVLSR